MTNTTPPERIIRTDLDLFDLWTELMGPHGFDRSSLWMVFLDEDRRMLPTVVPIEDRPLEPDEPMIRNLRAIVDGLAETGVRSVALLLTRPGPGVMTERDRRWARALTAVLGERLAGRPVHLATEGRIQTFAPDDLVAAS